MSRQPPPDIVTCAQNAMKQYNLWASLQLAQWALESAWGSRVTGKFNYFGVKANAGTLCWTHEYVNGKYESVQQTFKDYTSPQDAFNEHAELLVDPNGHYQGALPYLGNNLSSYVKAMAPHYATDPNYATSLLNLIHSNNLIQYDTNGANDETS